jgi:outer membrane receptor protein involved in Fe transport
MLRRLLPALVVLGAHVRAAEPPVELAPLEVFAPRPDAPPAPPPAAVTTHAGDFLARAGVATPAGLDGLVPGFFASDQSVSTPSLGIRGVTTDNVDPRAEERVAVYQDGVPVSRTAGSAVAFFDLERVDVFKGPQPARFLRGAQAGAVSIVSKAPEPARSAGATVEVAEHGARSLEAFVNAPLADDSLSARVAVLADQRDGYVDNLAPGAGPLQGADTRAVRASLRWSPGERATVDLVLNHERNTPPGVAFKSMVIPTRRGDTDPFSAADLNRGDALGIERDLTSLALSLRAELNEAWTLTSLSAGRRFDLHEEYDADGSPLFLLEPANLQRDRQLSQELRLGYDAGEKFTATLGTGVFWSRGEQTNVIRTDERRAWALFSRDFRSGLVARGLPSALADAAVPVLDPFGPEATLPATLPAEFALFADPLLPPGVQALSALAGAPLSARHTESYEVEAETRALELFGEAAYRLTDRLTLGGALRLTAERIRSGYFVPDSGTGRLGFLLGGGNNNAYRATPGRLENDDHAYGWSGRADLRYQFTPAVEGFAAVSRGRRPPSLGRDQVTLEPVRLDEEILWNHELGLRGHHPARRVDWAASVFHYTYDGFQTRSITAPGVVGLVDGGRARGRGFEVSASGELASHLALFGGYGFTDARFSSFDGEGRPQAYAGNTPRLAARHAFSLGGTLTIPAATGGAFYLSPIFRYRSETFFEDDNSLFGGALRQGGHGVLDLVLAYRPRRGAWEAAVFAENLLDRDYLLDAGNVGASFGIPTTVRAAPRTLGLRLTARF